MKKLNLLLRAIIVIIMFTVSAGFSLAADQEITLSPASTEQAPGSEFRLTVIYNVSDGDNTLSSLGVRIHFDSTQLEYNDFENFFDTNKLADPLLQDDVDNKDTDENTDKVIVLSYADPFNNSWPNQQFPLDIVTFVFTVKNDASVGLTNVNVTKISGHVGYGFVGGGCGVDIRNEHTVTFTEGANGMVTGDKTQTVIEGGDCTAVTAVPDVGYQFAEWTGDYTGTENPLTITNVTSDMTITANFTPVQHTVTFTTGLHCCYCRSRQWLSLYRLDRRLYRHRESINNYQCHLRYGCHG